MLIPDIRLTVELSVMAISEHIHTHHHLQVTAKWLVYITPAAGQQLFLIPGQKAFLFFLHPSFFLPPLRSKFEAESLGLPVQFYMHNLTLKSERKI